MIENGFCISTKRFDKSKPTWVYILGNCWLHFVFFIFFLKPAALFPGGLAARCLCCNFLYCIIRPVV